MPIRDPFAEVLERVQREAQDDTDGASLRPVGASGFQVPFTAAADAFTPASSDALAGLYDEQASDAARPSAFATDPDAIARELGLAHAATADDLNRIRRRFARVSHPDLVAPALRDVATQRMMIANCLIDDALAQLGQ